MLYATAQWPVFDFLHRLSRRSRLENDLVQSDDEEEQDLMQRETVVRHAPSYKGHGWVPSTCCLLLLLLFSKSPRIQKLVVDPCQASDQQL